MKKIIPVFIIKFARINCLKFLLPTFFSKKQQNKNRDEKNHPCFYYKICTN